ncbi:hypothetical protein BH10PSE6_BH10PSE6_22300 [soil metagenome]
MATARPVTKAARTATIGCFEATLVRDRPEDRVVQSGIRALDWREAIRVPLEPQATEWKLYVRLFDDVDRKFTRLCRRECRSSPSRATATSWCCRPTRRPSLDGDVVRTASYLHGVVCPFLTFSAAPFA